MSERVNCKLVYKANIEAAEVENKIELPALGNGIYLLRVLNGSELIDKKISVIND